MGKEFVMTYCEECFLIVSMFEYSKLQPGYIAGLRTTVRRAVQGDTLREMLCDSIRFRVYPHFVTSNASMVWQNAMGLKIFFLFGDSFQPFCHARLVKNRCSSFQLRRLSAEDAFWQCRLSSIRTFIEDTCTVLLDAMGFEASVLFPSSTSCHDPYAARTFARSCWMLWDLKPLSSVPLPPHAKIADVVRFGGICRSLVLRRRLLWWRRG